MKLSSLLLLFFSLFFIEKNHAQTQNQYIIAGDKAYQVRDYFTAISYYQKAFLFQKKSSEIQFKIGNSYLELKDYNNAIKSYSKVEDKSSFPSLFHQLGNSYMYIGDYDQAIKYLELNKSKFGNTESYSENNQQKLESCYWARDHQDFEQDILIESFKDVNTEFSEFSFGDFKNNMRQVTSFHQEEDNKKSDYVSEIHFFDEINNHWVRNESYKPMSIEKEMANGFYLKEKERFYFNLCDNTKDNLKRCDIYLTKFENNAWSSPIALNINDADYTSTQASVYVNAEGKDVLYFVSNREGGKGKLDIWNAVESEFGVFEELIVLGDAINTSEDETSPYYDHINEELFFSSTWHYGYGGYDIFKSKFINNKFQKPTNIGLPYNSSANDLNFKTVDGSGTLSSNREGALKLKGVSCCYDIFSFSIDSSKIIARKDSIVEFEIALKKSKKDSMQKILTDFNNMETVIVYFHNDEPNPKTTDNTTTISYNESYLLFKNLKNDYYSQNEFQEIDAFFYDHLEKGNKDFQTLIKELEKVVSLKKVSISLNGFCSPLAENDYNLMLSKRRIASIKNSILESEKIKEAISKRKITFIENPYGEETANKKVSDDYHNTKLSIFNPKAALERKVSIEVQWIE